MSFAASWYRASCALLLLTLYFFMFSFYLPFFLSLPLSLYISLPLSLSLSLSRALALSLSRSLSLSFALLLSLSLSLPRSLPFSLSMSLCGCKTRVIWCPLPSSTMHMHGLSQVSGILFLINLTFHTLSLHNSYKIHQPFTDYFLRLPYSELLEKHLFRSRANRRLVLQNSLCGCKSKQTWSRTLV